MTEIKVRLATPQDLGRVADIERQNSANPWSAAQLSTELENEFAYLLCAELAGDIAGLCDVHIAFDDAHINEVAVAEEHRRKGVAAALIAKAAELAKQHGCDAVTLEVRASNRTAKEFYAAQGFQMIGQKWGFYRDPSDDALVLQKEI